MVSNVELFAQLAAQGGLNLQQYAIQVFTFVPDSSGYVVVLHKGDRSLTRCAWHNVPAGLDQLLEREAANGVRHVTAGMNGSYVVILNSGVVWWKGVPPTLNKLLDDAEKCGRGVKVKHCNFLLGCSGPEIDAPIVLPQAVSLSLVAADWFFVEFVDGATQFVLPPQWHGAVNKYTAQNVRKQVPTMVTSFASTPSPSHSTPSPHTSRFGSHSSFSPLNSPNPASVFHTPNPRPVFHTPNPAPVYNTPNPAPFYNTPNPAPVYNTPNPGPVYGHAPYTPNPYVQPYATVPQFVPQPPPPPPPQQHQQAVHVTNVYNTIQQPEKPSHNSSGTVQLLGGALKVAGALLPLFTGGNNSNGGGFF